MTGGDVILYLITKISGTNMSDLQAHVGGV